MFDVSVGDLYSIHYLLLLLIIYPTVYAYTFLISWKLEKIDHQNSSFIVLIENVLGKKVKKSSKDILVTNISVN